MYLVKTLSIIIYENCIAVASAERYHLYICLN